MILAWGRYTVPNIKHLTCFYHSVDKERHMDKTQQLARKTQKLKIETIFSNPLLLRRIRVEC